MRVDSSMVRHVFDCLRNVVVNCCQFDHCNVIASKCLFTLQQSFGIAHEIAVKIKLFCGLMLLNKSTFDTQNQMCRLFAFPFASFCVLPCATSSFCAPVCHFVLSPLRFRWADHCLNVSSFCALVCVLLRFTVFKPWLFNEQRKCSYFDSCSNLASQTPVCGVLLIECPSCGHSSLRSFLYSDLGPPCKWICTR